MEWACGCPVATATKTFVPALGNSEYSPFTFFDRYVPRVRLLFIGIRLWHKASERSKMEIRGAWQRTTVLCQPLMWVTQQTRRYHWFIDTSICRVSQIACVSNCMCLDYGVTEIVTPPFRPVVWHQRTWQSIYGDFPMILSAHAPFIRSSAVKT